MSADIETVVLASIAKGVLDRPALYALPTARLMLLAKVAHRARVMERRELDQIGEDYTRLGAVRTPKHLAPLGEVVVPVLLGESGGAKH